MGRRPELGGFEPTAAAAAAAAPVALEFAEGLVDRLVQAANTELIGYHRTVTKIQGKKTITTTTNASLKAWEAAIGLGLVMMWEFAFMISNAVGKLPSELLNFPQETANFVVGQTEFWSGILQVPEIGLIAALLGGQQSQPLPKPPPGIAHAPAKTAFQALDGQLALLFSSPTSFLLNMTKDLRPSELRAISGALRG